MIDNNHPRPSSRRARVPRFFAATVLNVGTLISCPPLAAQPTAVPIPRTLNATPSTGALGLGVLYNTPPVSVASQDLIILRSALQAAASGDAASAALLQARLSDPTAQKVVTWIIVDKVGFKLDFSALSKASRELQGWPKPARLQVLLEQAMSNTALPPQQIIQTFAARDPETGEGANALATAYLNVGRQAEARALVERFWRSRNFTAESQSSMLQRFGAYLTADDHAARLAMLLYGNSVAEARQVLPLVATDQQAVAQARIAFRGGTEDAVTLFNQIPASLQNDPGLAYDRANYYRKHNLESLAANLTRFFPAGGTEQLEVSRAVWKERRAIMSMALQSQDYRGAYTAADTVGLQDKSDAIEAEFFAGWIALTKLRDASLADAHFARIQSLAISPISLARGLYWRGRAAAAMGDQANAKVFWTNGAQYQTVFYGQLSAARIGQAQLNIGVDPLYNADDRASFEALEMVKAMRIAGDTGDRDYLATFALAALADCKSPAQVALLVDAIRMYGDQWLSMRVVRSAAQRGLILPERGYPTRTPPSASGHPETAFIFAITRQESSFDPNARSGVGARGLMQLMPDTAAEVARKIGLAYSSDRLSDPDYNLQIGGSYLGQLTDRYGGSYLLATAAYDAGLGRVPRWIASCGDPRVGDSDAADFVECIPFSETRDYVMRVLEAVQVYRARLHGGIAPLLIISDLKRGAASAAVPSSNAAVVSTQ